MTLISDSNRTVDEFGYMTVENCVITGDDVAPYWGYEIPNFKDLGLDPKKIYHVYRPLDEIKDSNFSNKPLLSQHMDFSATDYKSKFIVGTTATIEPIGEQLKGPIVFWKQTAINELERGKKYLSGGYLYTPVLEKGFHKNQSYDLKMVNIVANHVAMVDNPRYKPAIVADEDIKNEEGESMFAWNNKKTTPQGLTFDEAIDEVKKILTGDASEEEKEKAVEKVKEKMSKDKMSKDKTAKDKKDEELDDNESEGAEDEDPEPQEEPTAKKKKMTGDSIQKLVADSVAKEMEKFTKKTLAFDTAIKEYERVCGRVNRLAFDSDAEKVLDTILKNHKHNSEGKTFEQKQAMVEMIPALRGAQQPAKIVMDNASTGSKCVPDNIIKFLDKRA